MLSFLITSKNRLRMLIKFFINSASVGFFYGLVNEFIELTESITKNLSNLPQADCLLKPEAKNKIGSYSSSFLNKKLDSNSIIL